MADVTIGAHVEAKSQAGLVDAARRLAIQEDMIAHMAKTLMEGAGVSGNHARAQCEYEARRAFFLITGYLQAAKDFGILK